MRTAVLSIGLAIALTAAPAVRAGIIVENTAHGPFDPDHFRLTMTQSDVNWPVPNNDNFDLTQMPWFNGNFGSADNTGIYDIEFVENRPIDIVFVVEDSGGVTEYEATFFLRNQTDHDWVGLTLQIGTGIGDAFMPIDDAIGLDFDTPHRDMAPEAWAFDLVAHTPTRIEWGGTGRISPPQREAFFYNLDVPDAAALGEPAGGYSFTIRHQPVALPEPSTLLGLGVLGLITLRRRR
jgi:hypothetical protein